MARLKKPVCTCGCSRRGTGGLGSGSAYANVVLSLGSMRTAPPERMTRVWFDRGGVRGRIVEEDVGISSVGAIGRLTFGLALRIRRLRHWIAAG